MDSEQTTYGSKIYWCSSWIFMFGNYLFIKQYAGMARIDRSLLLDHWTPPGVAEFAYKIAEL